MKKKIKTSELLKDKDMKNRSSENLKDILIFIGQNIWHDYSEVSSDIKAELKRRQKCKNLPYHY